MADPADPRPDDPRPDDARPDDARPGASRADGPTGAADVPVTGPERVQPAETAVRAESPVPTEAELAQVAEPAQLRRAPKVGAFIVAGVLVGALLGLVAALVVGPDSGLVADGTAFIGFLEGQGSARFLSALMGAILGGFVGAALALLADRRSLRRSGRDRRG